MFTILHMGMVMYPAGTEIKYVSGNDKCYSRNQHPALVLNKELLHDQEGEAGKE